MLSCGARQRRKASPEHTAGKARSAEPADATESIAHFRLAAQGTPIAASVSWQKKLVAAGVSWRIISAQSWPIRRLTAAATNWLAIPQ